MMKTLISDPEEEELKTRIRTFCSNRENIQIDGSSILIDCLKMEEQDYKLLDCLIETPNEIIAEFEEAISSLCELPQIRFINLKNLRLIHKIRTKDVGKLFLVRGMIKRTTRILPRTTSITYECPSCGTHIQIPQDKKKIKRPTKCSCGRKDTFNEVSKKTINIQELNLEETQEDAGEKQPQQIRIYLEDPLTDSTMTKRLQPGKRVEIIGVVNLLPAFMCITDESLNLSEFMINANNIISLEQDEEIKLTEEDIKEIEDIAAHEPLTRMAGSLAPEVYGNEMIKKALILQQLKGVKKLKSDGTYTRADIHILLCGDPGISKSVSLNAIKQKTPRCGLVVGNRTSKVGIGGMVVKDDLTGTWSVIGETLIPTLDKNNNFSLKKIEEIYNKQDFNNVQILGVDESTKEPKWVKCKEIICHPFNGRLITLKQKYGEITATECHSIYDRDMRVFQSQENKEMYSLRNIIIPVKDAFEIDLIKMTNQRDKKTGKFLGSGKFLRSQYSNKQDIKDLLKVCAWYISEGCLSQNNKKRSWKVIISNNNRNELLEVAGAFQRISESKSNLSKYGGKRINKKSRGKIINVVRTSSLELCSKQLYYFVKTNCGHYSINKKIPNFIFNLNREYKEYFFNELMKGDGCIKKQSYTTISKELAAGVGILLSSLNKNFSYLHGPVNKDHPNSLYQMNLINNNFDAKKRAQELTELLLYHFKDKWFSIRDFESLLLNIGVLGGGLKLKNLRRKYSKREYSKNFMFINRLNKKGLLEKKVINSRKIIWKVKDKHLRERVNSLKENKGVSNKISIKESKGALVYDIVNSETSNFIGGIGNILLHNSLEAGSLVLNSGGTLCIDEFDKMPKEHLAELLEPMSSATSTIAKANIHSTMPAETNILAAANPKEGTFFPDKPIATQLDLPSPNVNRFDLIFIMLDKPNKEYDENSITHVFQNMTEKRIPEIDNLLFKKYIYYCRKLTPKLKPELLNSFKDFYVNLRQLSENKETGDKGLPINLRNIEGLIRLSEANAKLRLSEFVEEQDVKVAKEIFMFCLRQVGMDSETGLIDQSRITKKIPDSKRGKLMEVLSMLEGLSQRIGNTIPYQEVIIEAEKREIKKNELNDFIEELKIKGQIYEPRKGYFSVL